MFDPLPENVPNLELQAARANAFRRLWTVFKLLLPVAAIVIGGIALLLGLLLCASMLWARPRGPRVRTVSGSVVRAEVHTGS